MCYVSKYPHLTICMVMFHKISRALPTTGIRKRSDQCVRQFGDHLAELYDDYDGSNRQLAAVQEYKEKSQR